jgi:hypothetical protein
LASREQGAGMPSANMIEPFGAEWKVGYGATFVDHLHFETDVSLGHIAFVGGPRDGEEIPDLVHLHDRAPT